MKMEQRTEVNNALCPFPRIEQSRFYFVTKPDL